MKKILLSPRVLLPVMVSVGIMVMGMRVADMWETVSSGKLSLHAAQAADVQAKSAEAPAKENLKPSAELPQAESPKMSNNTPREPTMVLPPPDPDASPAELDVLRQLSDRREQIEKRGRDMDTRESLLKVTEQRVDQKIKEMQTLRLQLQSMVSSASEAQQVQLENLVKIYETMKPDEAARIFEKLDMPVLLGVIQKMKPKNTAPIMAKMAPEKAKEITDALTKTDQLPQIK